MPITLNFYLDDSGTRHPTRSPGKKPAHGYDWFALGGVMIRSDQEPAARALHGEFCRKWQIATNLHSSEIRSQNTNFEWLRGLDDAEKMRFYEELYCLMRDAPVTGIACVIDRPGYNRRYLELYQRNPWLLCKTAFSVSVERAAKYARQLDLKLRVFPERCNKSEDRLLMTYYNDLRNTGMPFDGGNSEKYNPLNENNLRETLYEFHLKRKSSPMMQIADLMLWPICMGGYHASNRTYKRLMSDDKLIECRLDPAEWSALGSKYSCFDQVERKP